MSADAPGRWSILSASVRGATHVRSGLPNQDAVRAETIVGGAILAVSDGHGSPKCFRSHIGSKLAVDMAVAVLSDWTGKPAADVEASAATPPGEIVRRWQAAVSADRAASPFTPEETAALQQRDPLVAYGATLVCVLLGPDYVLYLQLGDGEILTVSEASGRPGTDAKRWSPPDSAASPEMENHREAHASRSPVTVESPIAADATLIANETTSLCQEDAARNFRIRFQPFDQSPPALILLATDGYPNSFATPAGFRRVATDLLAMLDQDGVDTVAAALPGWLDEASQFGSGDDVSVAILYRPIEASP